MILVDENECDDKSVSIWSEEISAEIETRLRRAFRDGQLSADDIKALEEAGFEFASRYLRNR